MVTSKLIYSQLIGTAKGVGCRAGLTELLNLTRNRTAYAKQHIKDATANEEDQDEYVINEDLVVSLSKNNSAALNKTFRCV